MFRESAIANAVIFIGPALLGVIMAILIPNALGNQTGFAWATMLFYGLGLTLFVIAKLSLIRQGIRVSFGSDKMSPWYRWIYRTGYCLMGLGVLSTVALVVMTRVSS